jgi:E3 ubiquitin-protein ligase HACE1
LACIDEEPEVARQILKLKKIPNLNRFTAQSTLLCITSRGGSSEMFRILLEFGADPNGQTQKGDTPLICAARNGHIECLEHLLDLGVDVNGKGHRGWTALHWASLNGRYEIAATLVAYGANIDCLTDDGASCIFLGCLSGHSNLVEDMIRYGATVFTIDSKGDTPLHAAARQNGSSVKPLIKANAAYIRNNAGETPIDAALARGHRKFIDAILLSKPELRQNFHREAVTLASSLCHDTRSFENIFKVLSELSKLDFTHFESSLEHITSKIASITPMVLSQSSTQTNIAIATFVEVSLQLTTVNTKSNPDLTISTEVSESSSSSSTQQIKPNNPPTELSITIFKRLANALINLTHDVLRTPKIVALLECSNLRTKIQGMLSPLESVWLQIESHISSTMIDLERSDRSEESKKIALSMLADIPAMIDSYYNISRMTLINNQIQKWDSSIVDSSSETQQNLILARLPSIHFLSFIDRIHEALRFIISADSNLLTGNLHFLLDLPTSVISEGLRSFSDLVEGLSFEQKRNWLRVKIESEQSSAKTGSKIQCDRIENSSASLLNCARSVTSDTPENLRGKLFVKFEGELGVGAGVQREWFQFIVEKLMSEETGLFEATSDRVSFNPISDAKKNDKWSDEERRILFNFTGRLLAMAIVHEEHLNLKLSLPIYKSILKRSHCLEDMEKLDETVYKSMKWILNNSGIEDLGLNFEATYRGTSVTYDLIEGISSNVDVTEENKTSYVEKLLDFYFQGEISSSLDAIASGFYDIVPWQYVSPLSETELDMVLCGQSGIDLSDWKLNTDYSGELSAESDVVMWFWNFMERSNVDTHRKVLQFVTGSTNVPLGGFKQLRGVDSKVKFNISRAPKDNGALPTASTCFNMLKLPNFTSQIDFEKKLEMSISDGRLGFSFN